MFHLSFFGIIGSLIVGAIVGWLAGKIMTGKGFGIVMDVVLGVVSGLIVSIVLGLWLGDNGPGWIIRFILSLVVACLLVGIAHVVKREPFRTA
ncbi:MAG TPA: GlsB/YeaQ/YmgE family stress response membrane protein [Candidatus Dormibacteraeota bacterium]|nr:GlsB/YeaQ/YmgE family stress response membrane protein [Candidatus Dormibacteraeota bacterium]